MSTTQSKAVEVLRVILLLPISLIILLPVLLFLVPLGLYAYVDLIRRAIFTKWKMKKQGRFVSESRLRKEVSNQDSSGTFILESYTIGWGVARLWWTPDTISKEDASIAPDDASDDPYKKLLTPHYGKIYDAYTDLEKKVRRSLEDVGTKKRPSEGGTYVSLHSNCEIIERRN